MTEKLKEKTKLLIDLEFKAAHYYGHDEVRP